MINNNTFITYIVQITCTYDQMHIDFQRRNGISGPLPPTFQLTWRGIFFFFSDKAQIGSHRPCRNSLFFDGFSRFLSSQLSHFVIQPRNNVV